MAYSVYMTFNKLDPSKCYIGMTSKNNSNYKGSGKIIKQALKKYGKENFSRVDLAVFDNKEECHYWEGFYIQMYKTEVKYGGYNISPKGGLGTPGCLIHTQESKDKISKNCSFRRPEVIEKIRIKQIGRKRSSHFCEITGNIHRGKKVSDESRSLMSTTKKKLFAEGKLSVTGSFNRKGLKPWNLGIPCTQESKDKRRKTMADKKIKK